jgi:hypothetical protein
VFSVAGISDRGNASACKTSRASVSTAAEAFYAKNGNYPTSTAQLLAAPDRFLVLGDLDKSLKVGDGTNGLPAGTESISGPNNQWELQIAYTAGGRTAPSFSLINC